MEDNESKNKSSLILNANVKGAVTPVEEKQNQQQQEFYRPLPEPDLQLSSNKNDNTAPTMVQEENPVNDGADEQMLGTEDKEKLSTKREEVKFIKGDHQNGDAKIDIGVVNGKTFTGMTKEELMKYANDPFWVRLRWIFFIGFWAVWVGMLVGAILIIVDAPKCAAPEPLPWYKRGLLAKYDALNVGPADLKAAEKLKATGVIYELPAELTYSIREAAVEEQIKQLVASYKDSDMKVILDITPNYVSKDSQLMKNALNDTRKRAAFVWLEGPKVPNNWLSIVNGSAWAEVSAGNYVLSQFGDGLYDLHMNDAIVKKEFSDVLKHLLELGVGGFRLKNTKFYLITKTIQDEIPAVGQNYIHDEYGFWTHTQTTFQDGLGDLLYEYRAVVKNASADALLTAADDMVRPEVYKTKNAEYGIDIPIYGRLIKTLSNPVGSKNVRNELLNIIQAVGKNTWLQWNFGEIDEAGPVHPSAIGLFVSLLPGVPVIPSQSEAFTNITDAMYKHIHQLRSSPSYMHGDFDIHNSEQLVAYSRIKSGNPGYFVIFNPTDITIKGDFSNLGLPDKMTVDIFSSNYNVINVTTSRTNVMTNSIDVSSYATIILTYVPVKSG